MNNDILNQYIMQTQRQMEPPIDKQAIVDFLESEAAKLMVAAETIRNYIPRSSAHIPAHEEEREPTVRTEAKIAKIGVKKRASIIAIPTVYKKDSTYVQKILFALNSIGEGTTREIERFVEGKEPELAPKTVHNNVAKTCIRLYENKIIDMEKRGNANLYMLALKS